jgi:hypothetical protein
MTNAHPIIDVMRTLRAVLYAQDYAVHEVKRHISGSLQKTLTGRALVESG